MAKLDIFIDSGAFTAFTKGAKINLDDYIRFLKENLEYISVYSNLDVIGDPEQTLRNQKLMEAAGLKPLPCFHYGEPISYLKYYLDNYDYIALGGMVPITNEALKIWLDRLFSDYLCDSTGMPRVKVHGFGLTTVPLLTRYPWYSVDSSVWLLQAGYGVILVPVLKQGKYDYLTTPYTVKVSSRFGRVRNTQHIHALSEKERRFVLDYIHSKGFQLGRSEIFEVGPDYRLGPNERWIRPVRRKGRASRVPKRDRRPRLVERVVEPGLCNCHLQRRILNCQYFLELESQLPEWPWPFRVKSKPFFGGEP